MGPWAVGLSFFSFFEVGCVGKVFWGLNPEPQADYSRGLPLKPHPQLCFLFVLVVLEFDLRASCLLDRHSTARAMCLALYFVFEIGAY
jgi:hypothetical protein